jgi:hypothetical protein
VLRRSEQTRFLSASDDEVGGLRGAIRVRDVRAADLQEEPTNASKNALILRHQSFRLIRRRRRLPANIAASEASNQTERAQASGAIKLGRLGPCLGPSRL